MSIYGWDAIHVKYFDLQSFQYHNPTPQQSLEIPQTELAVQTHDYAEGMVNELVMKHSMRVFFYMKAVIHDYFPAWDIDEEVLYVTSLLHFIPSSQLDKSHLSAAYASGIMAHEFLMRVTHGNKDFSESVTEALFRQQGMNERKGNTTRLSFILQLCVMIDCVGDYEYNRFIHPDTLHYINKKYPRKGWQKHMMALLEFEDKSKPWGFTTTLGEEFIQRFRQNALIYTHDDDGLEGEE